MLVSTARSVILPSRSDTILILSGIDLDDLGLEFSRKVFTVVTIFLQGGHKQSLSRLTPVFPLTRPNYDNSSYIVPYPSGAVTAVTPILFGLRWQQRRSGSLPYGPFLFERKSRYLIPPSLVKSFYMSASVHGYIWVDRVINTPHHHTKSTDTNSGWIDPRRPGTALAAVNLWTERWNMREERGKGATISLVWRCRFDWITGGYR